MVLYLRYPRQNTTIFGLIQGLTQTLKTAMSRPKSEACLDATYLSNKVQLKTKNHSMLEWSVIAGVGLEPTASGL